METTIQRANRIKSEFGLDEVEFKNSFALAAKIESSDSESHTVIKYVSKPTVDRSNDIVISQGINLKDFLKSPQVLYAHNYGNSWMDGGNPVLPVGTDEWIKYDGKGLLAKQKYHMITSLSEELFKMHDAGYPLPSSIGFIPTKTIYRSDFDEKAWKKEVERLSEAYGLDKKSAALAGRVYESSILLEHSDVPVAANPDAISLALKSGQIEFKSEELQQAFESLFLNNRITDLTEELGQLRNDHLIMQKLIERLSGDITIAPKVNKSITKEYIAHRVEYAIINYFDKKLGKC